MSNLPPGLEALAIVMDRHLAEKESPALRQISSDALEREEKRLRGLFKQKDDLATLYDVQRIVMARMCWCKLNGNDMGTSRAAHDMALLQKDQDRLNARMFGS